MRKVKKRTKKVANRIVLVDLINSASVFQFLLVIAVETLLYLIKAVMKMYRRMSVGKIK